MPVNVLEFGSSSIRVMVAKEGINGTFCVLCQIEKPYSGYYEGEFISTDELQGVLAAAVSEARNECKKELTEFYISVPAEFSSVLCRNAHISFPRKKAITDNDMFKFYDEADELKNNKTIKLISTSALSFVLDDGRKVSEPIGEKSAKLSGEVSLVYAESKFIELINKIVKELGVTKVVYVSEPLVLANYLLDDEAKEKANIIIDSGYITTSVMIARGGGLELLSSFSIGAGHIASDLSDGLELSYDEAERLKGEIVLSTLPSVADKYEIARGKIKHRVPLKLTNDIVKYRLDMIAVAINKCLELYGKSLSHFTEIYLTGGGITHITGAKDYLSKQLGRNIKVLAPNLPTLNKPELSTRFALTNHALLSQKKQSGFLAKIFKR